MLTLLAICMDAMQQLNLGCTWAQYVMNACCMMQMPRSCMYYLLQVLVVMTWLYGGDSAMLLRWWRMFCPSIKKGTIILGAKAWLCNWWVVSQASHADTNSWCELWRVICIAQVLNAKNARWFWCHGRPVCENCTWCYVPTVELDNPVGVEQQ